MIQTYNGCKSQNVNRREHGAVTVFSRLVVASTFCQNSNFFPLFLCVVQCVGLEKDGEKQVRDKEIFVAVYSAVDIYLTQRGRSLSM